jgi:hypothetical protein
MNPFGLNEFVLISALSFSEQVAFAARCARLAVRLLNQISFPVAPSEVEVMDNAVRLAEQSVTGSVNLPDLEAAVRAAGQLAFASVTQSRFRTDMVIGHVAHSAYAAARTALSGSAAHAQDALDYAFEAARTAGARETESLIREELRRLRKPSLPRVEPAN